LMVENRIATLDGILACARNRPALNKAYLKRGVVTSVERTAFKKAAQKSMYRTNEYCARREYWYT
jgi:hypothetical protein